MRDALSELGKSSSPPALASDDAGYSTSLVQTRMSPMHSQLLRYLAVQAGLVILDNVSRCRFGRHQYC